MTLGPDDFEYPNIDYPNDAHGNPRYPEPDPRHPSWVRLSNWQDLGRNGNQLRPGIEGGDIAWVYTHPYNWRVWHLSGKNAGREGVELATNLDGVMDPDYEIKYQSGAYIVGAEAERVDYPMRAINMGVWILGNTAAANMHGPFRYLMIEDAWRQSWSETVPGYLGSFNRVHGWRWLQVLKGKGDSQPLKMSPTAHGNNALLMNFTAHAPYPMYAKRALTASWKNSAELVSNGAKQALYRGYYNSGNNAPSPITNTNWPIYWSGIGKMVQQEFIDSVNAY